MMEIIKQISGTNLNGMPRGLLKYLMSTVNNDKYALADKITRQPHTHFKSNIEYDQELICLDKYLTHFNIKEITIKTLSCHKVE